MHPDRSSGTSLERLRSQTSQSGNCHRDDPGGTQWSVLWPACTLRPEEFDNHPGKERRQIVKAIAGPQIVAGGVSAPLALDPHRSARTTTDGFPSFQSGEARHVQTT